MLPHPGHNAISQSRGRMTYRQPTQDAMAATTGFIRRVPAMTFQGQAVRV